MAGYYDSASVLAALLGMSGNLLSTAMTNVANAKLHAMANATNMKIAASANTAQALESEKAYNRSKATNQVALLRQAGMSHAGAVNMLSGGGSYTPAPVNTAQVSAPIMQGVDFSSLLNVGQAIDQLNEQKRANKVGESIAQQSADIAKQNADTEKSRVDNENMLRNQEFYIREYDHGMRILRDNVDLMREYNDVSHLVDPVRFKSAFEFVEAVLKESGKKELSAIVRDQLENKWSIANSDKLTGAQTGKTYSEKKHLDEQFKMLQQEVQEFLSSESKASRVSARDAQKAEDDLRKLMADYSISDNELRRSYYYVFDEEGNLKPNGWSKFNENLNLFWNSVFELIPVNLLAQALAGVTRLIPTKTKIIKAG